MQTIGQIEKEIQSKYDKIILKYLRGEGLSCEEIQELTTMRNNPFVYTNTTDWRIMKLLLELESKNPLFPIYSKTETISENKNRVNIKNNMYTLEDCDSTIHIEHPIFQYRNSGHVLYLIKTCPASPEEYSVFNSRLNRVGYIRIRHGKLRVDHITFGEANTIFTHLFEDKYKGSFTQEEWNVYIPKACDLLIKRINCK